MWELARSLWAIKSQHRLAARGLIKGKLLNGGQVACGGIVCTLVLLNEYVEFVIRKQEKIDVRDRVDLW